MDDKKNVYITLHKNFVHEGIEYEDRKTGETKTFNSVTLPKGTVVNGQDAAPEDLAEQARQDEAAAVSKTFF